MEKGDYVLATKFNGGDPEDHWCVGFWDSSYEVGSGTRNMVIDHKGNQFRNNGFRRVEKISTDVGKFLVDNKIDIELSGICLWEVVCIARTKYFENQKKLEGE